MHASTAAPHAKIFASGRSSHARKQLPHWNHMSCGISLGSTWHACVHTQTKLRTNNFPSCMCGEQFSAQEAPVSKPSSIASRMIWSKSYVVSRMWYGVAKSTPQQDKTCAVIDYLNICLLYIYIYMFLIYIYILYLIYKYINIFIHIDDDAFIRACMHVQELHSLS